MLVGAGASLVAMGAGLLANRSAHVEDDPEYCASCHSVEVSLDSLDAGGHGDISCLECHSTSFRDEARDGVARVFGASLAADHPTLANRSSCAACHSGDDASAENRTEGIAVHEAHLGSSDPEIAGMACTSCHTVEGHAFEPTTSGCTASRCHSDVSVRLGQMAHENLDCADCHALPAEVVQGDTTLLVPASGQCLGCHEMQQQIAPPEVTGEPHGQACSWCHKPHDQVLVSEAATTCTSAGCHARPDTLVAAHRGLAPGVLEGCVGCHAPHQAHVQQQDCVACHDATGGLLPGVTGPPPPGTPGSSTFRGSEAEPGKTPTEAPGVASGATPASLGRLARDAVAERLVALRHAASGAPTAATVGPAEAWTRIPAALHTAPDTTLNARFTHDEHTTVDCVSCHTADGSEHGELVVRTAGDCRQCHHLADDAPTCATCHEGAEPGGSGIVRTLRLDLTVLDRLAYRDVPFSHDTHASEDCATCHLPSLTRTADAEDCQSCHVEHHEAALECNSCHVPAPTEKHPVAQVHLGCGGAGCHTDAPAPIDERLRDRSTCLTCHGEQAIDHYEPATGCAQCHLLPPPRPAASHVGREESHP